jgi:hypothetical protein
MTDFASHRNIDREDERDDFSTEFNARAASENSKLSFDQKELEKELLWHFENPVN